MSDVSAVLPSAGHVTIFLNVARDCGPLVFLMFLQCWSVFGNVSYLPTGFELTGNFLYFTTHDQCIPETKSAAGQNTGVSVFGYMSSVPTVLPCHVSDCPAA